MVPGRPAEPIVSRCGGRSEPQGRRDLDQRRRMAHPRSCCTAAWRSKAVCPASPRVGRGQGPKTSWLSPLRRSYPLKLYGLRSPVRVGCASGVCHHSLACVRAAQARPPLLRRRHGAATRSRSTDDCGLFSPQAVRRRPSANTRAAPDVSCNQRVFLTAKQPEPKPIEHVAWVMNSVNEPGTL